MNTKSRYLPKFDLRLSILLLGQAVTGSNLTVLFLVSGLLGPTIAPDVKLSTLPVSLAVVGVALASPFAGMLMGRLGRKRGHLLGLLLTLLGVGTAGLALTRPDFYFYSLGCLLAGVGQGFNNQIRFTAAESSTDQKALVHSWVLMFSLFAAFLGPGIAEFGRNWLSSGEYTGSLALLFGLIFCLALAFLLLPGGAATPASSGAGVAPAARIRTSEILRQGRFWQAALPGIASYVTMTLLMTATPLEMHHNHHFSHGDTTGTIRAHIIAMYLPSLFGGVLIAWMGVKRLIYLGLAIYAACIAVAFQSSDLHQFWWALVLLGVGWNFLFLAGSTTVSQNFTGPDRFAAQGANDTLVFGVQALASLAAGWLIFAIGWQALVFVPVPLLIATLIFNLRFK